MFIHVKSSESIPLAKRVLYGGGIIVFPTETVYKVGCLTSNQKAMQRLHAMKGREAEFIILCDSVDGASNIIKWSPLIERLAENFWPGPLTIVGRLKADMKVEEFFGRGRVAVRVPQHWWTMSLLKEVGPILCSTANRPGYTPPTTLAQTLVRFGRDADLYVDGGETVYGRESTKVDVAEGRVVILRDGALPAGELRRRL